METTDIKKVFETGDYSAVVELTKDSKDPKALFFRISSLINLKKERNALNCLLDNRQCLFYFSPLKTIDANITLRCFLKEFDEAYDDVEYYRNEKYMSQQVEEAIAGLKDRIRDEEKASLLEHDLDGVDELIKTIRKAKDDDTILCALPKLAKFPNDLPYCAKMLIEILEGNHSSEVKSFALMLLKMAGYDKEVTYCKRGKKYATVPLYLTLPFMDEGCKGEISLIKSLSKDSTVVKVASSLFNQYVTEIYPDDWMENRGDELLIAASFLGLAMDYLQIQNGNLSESLDVPPNDLERTKKAIQTVFEAKKGGLN